MLTSRLVLDLAIASVSGVEYNSQNKILTIISCTGQRFAILESKIVLSTLLRRFKFELSLLAKSPVIATQLILKSLTGINLVVSRR